MINAKEKAEELVHKMYAGFVHDLYTYKAKKCALIAVDEILDLGLGFMHDETAWNIEKYYQEVKQEIEKL
jgi:hypothetical protein